MRKLDTATFVGLIATIINFMFRPDAVHIFGFTVASIFFDVIASSTGHKRLFEKKSLGSIILFALSVISATIAGLIFGVFFMEPLILQRCGGIVACSGLHAIGGIIGGAVGVTLVNALTTRRIRLSMTMSFSMNHPLQSKVSQEKLAPFPRL